MQWNQRSLANIVALGFLTVAVASVGRAEPAPGNIPSCAAATPEQAKWLADELYRQGQYQRAGDCYQAAGDLSDANEAFVKAIRAKSETAAKDFHRQSDIAKTLFTGVGQAFRSHP
jgi:tetratricopeptide (TPR) repeat protein